MPATINTAAEAKAFFASRISPVDRATWKLRDANDDVQAFLRSATRGDFGLILSEALPASATDIQRATLRALQDVREEARQALSALKAEASNRRAA